MSNVLDQIVYPGSDQYLAEELAAPGSKPLDLYEEPLARAVDTAYILFEVPDLNKQEAFLSDFGLVMAEHSPNCLYMRGYGTAPYVYAARKGERARFLGAGFLLDSAEDLARVAQATGLPLEDVDGPGGGQRVRLTDPDGFLVDLVHGRSRVERLDTRREPLPVNLPDRKNRVNRGQRPPLQPSAVERFGHYVLMVTDFQRSWRWYRKHLGVIPTDVLCTADGAPALAFTRLDRGEAPADHHTVVLMGGPEARYMHSAYETLDQDAIGQGQQYLKWKGWKHFWGMGRHVLGSQIFDYWLDPWGQEVEHYADGDVFDSSYPTHYHLFDRGGLWAWGNDFPPDGTPRPGFKALMALLFGGAEKRRMLLQMKRALARPPRPWLK